MAEIDWESGEIKQPEGATADTDWEQGEIKPPPEPKGFLGHARDLGLSAVKSAIAVPETVVGLADIPTGGRVGKFLENEGGAVGFRPKQAKEFLGEFNTDAYKDQQRQFQEADGILDKTAVAIQNPSLIANTVTESVAPMLAGGVAARGLLAGTRLGQAGAIAAKRGATAAQQAQAAGRAAAAAGATGEGAMMAGAQSAAIRQETDDGLLTPTQAGAAVATGLAGTLFGYLGGRVAQRFGLGDVDTMLARGANPQQVASEIAALPAKSIPRQVVEGAISEGFLEELPQSISEQIIQNLALGKDWSEGVEDAAVMGPLAGMAMGGGASLYSGMTRPEPQDGGLPPPAAGNEPPAAGPQGFTPTLERPVIDESALGRAGIFPPAPAPIINERALEPTAPTPSQQMGLDPAAGPMSAAAALAVDTGASATMQQAAQAVDPETGEILEAGAKVPEQKQATDTPEQMRERLGFIEQQARVNGGWDRRTIEERDRLQAELAKVEPAASQAPTAEAVEPAPAIDVTGRTDEQLRVLEKAGRDGWREAAVAEIQRRATQQPAETPVPAVEPAAQAAVEQQAPADVAQAPAATSPAIELPTQTPTAPEQSRPAPSRRSESAQPSEAADPAEEVRRQLREVEDKILAAAPGAMGAGGGDIEAAMKSRKVPVTLKAQRTRLKEQLRQANQGELTPNVPPTQQVAPQAEEAGGQEGEAAGQSGLTDAQRSEINATAGSLNVGDIIETDDGDVVIKSVVRGQDGGVARYEVEWDGDKYDALPNKDAQGFLNLSSMLAPQPYVDANTGERRIGNPGRVVRAAQPTPKAQQVAPQAQEAGGQEGEKAKWIKATVDKSRLNGSGGVQLAVAPNGGVTFMGDPNTSKDGRALLANYEKALASGATQQEIAAALQAQAQRADAAQGQAQQGNQPETSQDAPEPEQDRRPMPSGLSFPSERIVTSVQSEFEALEVQASSIGTSDGYVNFGSQYPDGRYYIESAGKSIGFANGQWGDVTPEGLKPRGTYDPSNLQAETIRVLEGEGAKRSKSAEPAQPSADVARPDEGATAQPEQPEFTTLKDRDGKTVTVRTADLSGARERMPMFTKDGKRKTTWIHRDNLDPTGEKQAEGAKEMAGNPLFNVITTKDGGAFASEGAAERELRRRGLQETHEVVPASEVSSGSSGFVVRRAKTAESAQKREQPAQASDDDIDAMFDDALADAIGEQQTGEAETTATAEAPAATAVTTERPANQEAMAESLEDELRAQKKRVQRLHGGDATKLKAAEARLRAMRQSIFDAEDKWVPAARNGDQEALTKLEEAGFADTADAIRAFAPAAPRTAGKALKSAAKNAASALDDAINGLGKLFGGGGRLSSGLTFDEETYAKAKPLFIAAAANIRAASRDLRDVMKAVVDMVVDRFGADTAKNMKPYVTQFVKDVRDGKVQLEQEQEGDAGTAIYGDGAAPLGEVAAQDDRGNARGGNAEPSRATGEQGGSKASSGPDGGGNAEARGRGNGAAGSDPAEAGTGGRGRRVASKSRKAAPTQQELKEEAAEEIRQTSPINIPALDFVITDEVDLGKGTESVKFADNLAAIRALKQIEQENRRASPEEQRALARYVGWGGLKNAFRVAGARADQGVAKGWESRVAELEALLTPAEIRAARNSITAAHYTSQTVVEAVWKGVERLGFRGGAVLEPSVGTGNFLGLMPTNLRGNAKVLAAEYDSLAARIAQQLYPNQSILHSGFQDIPLPDNKFALAIGNPPFGRESLYFRHNPAINGKSIHNQFFLQSIQAIEAGGLMGMVVSHNLMDAQDQASRADMAMRAEFLGAVRLPDTAFKENARTEVVTDILFFRKRGAIEASHAAAAARILREGDGKRAAILKDFSPSEAATIDAILAEMQRWVPSSKQENFAGSGETISVNPYFLKNPAMVVGTMDASGTMNARADLNVRLDDPSTFAQRLSEAINRLPQREPVNGVAQRTMAQFEQMATGMRLAVARAEPGAVRRTPDGALKVVVEMDDLEQSRKTILNEIALTAQTPFSEAYTLRTDGKWQREEDVTGADGKPVKKLKKDGTPSNFNEKTIVTYDSLEQIPPRDQWGADRIAVVTDMLPVRAALKRQLMLEASDAPAAMIADHRKRLNAAYDSFTKKHGALHKPGTVKIAMTMPDGALALAVEDVAKDGTVSRAAILSRRVTVPPKPVERVSNAGEAVAVVLAETGGIDIKRVAKLLGTDEEGAAAALSEGDSPRAFFDPETNRWEPADGYLSGLVRRKLLAAKAAGLQKNVAALERVQPEAWDSTQITPNIGSAWVPPEVYADFLKHLGFGRSVVTYLPATNTFSIVTTGSAKAEWTPSQSALSTSEIVERTLNSKPVKVIHKDSGGKTWVDEEATLESQMKATEIANEFLDWAFADDARRDRLVEVFNEKFNTRVVRQRDGSFLTLPGKVPDEVIKMRPWQLNAIWRGITDSAVLYDHAVGAGKTFTAIARAMERRRMGLSKKPMIVVPNHLVEQWAADVKKLYPGANVLAAGKEDFEKSRRRRLFARIGSGDYDMVIVGHSSFGFIDIDPATEERYLDEELRIAYEAVDEAQKAAEEAGFSGWGKPMGVTDAERLVKKLEERLAKVRDSKRDRLLTFEEMGVDDLTIDEAHEFKNLAYSSNLQGAAGMGNKAGSAKAMDLNLKLRSLRERPGTSVAFLTGTPISNSVAEMYLVLKNLAPNDLAELGMENFDAWRTTFVSASSAYEPTESGSLKEVTRLGREWMNMKSLMDLYYTIADAVTLQDMKDDFARANPGKSFPVPKVRSQIEGKGDRAMVAIKPSESQRAILRDIVAGFDSLPGISDRKERNSQRLRLMDRARKVSLDARAVSPGLTVPDGEGKIGAVVDNVFATYEKWDADRGTQLVFLDRSVPKTKGDDKIIAAYDKLVADLEKATNKGDEKEIAAITEKLEKYSASEIEELRNAQNGGWNAYAEIKRQLVAKGVPANEIRFVQEANTDKQKADLFALVNSGKVRILIGSTPRMGAGTNVQDRLVALHHVDVTWKPSDIEQREGRIVRQGNKLLEKYGEEFTVDVIAYATEMTVDAKMWSLNSTKLKAINGVRKYDGSFMMEFDDEESASMAEMAALATGNPLMVERVTLDGDIKKLEMAQRTFNRRMSGIRSQIASAERTIKNGPQWAKTLRDFAQDMERKLAGVNERSDARRVTVNGKQYISAGLAELAAQASIEEQQAQTESGKGRYVVEVNGEKATSRERISALILEAMGDRGFEAEVGGTKVIDLSSAVRTILERRGSGREYTIDGITINGMSVEIDVAPSRWKPDTDSIATVAVLDRDGRPVLVREHYYQSPVLSGPSLRAALQKALASFDPAFSRADATSQERAVVQAERDIPDLKAQAEKTFPHLEDLNAKRDRLQEVVAELRATSDLARINAESSAVAGIVQTNPLRNADGTFARQDPAGDSLAFSATLPRDRNAVRIGITEKGLVRAMRLQFDGLADVTSKLLERGRAGKRGGVIVVGTADNAEIGRIVAERTGRKLDSTMRKFSSAGRLNGFYDPKTGLTFLVAPNLNPVTATAVMLHEMMHGQQRQKIDARALEMVRNRNSLKDEDLRAFLDRVMLRMIAAGEVGNAAEASAYLVEQAVIEGRSAGYAFADNAFMRWVDAKIGKRVGDFLRSFAGMIRTWMLRNGLGAKAMTVDDFVGYAMAGLDRAAAGEVRGRANAQASIGSRAPQSEAFRRWFGDSKVVDERGQPLVVYHGTQADFSVFDASRLGETTSAKSAKNGFFFASNPDVASTYAFLDRENIRRAKEIKLLIKENIEAGLVLRRKDKEKAIDAIEDKDGFRRNLLARREEIERRISELKKEQQDADKKDLNEWDSLAEDSDRESKFLATRIDGSVVYPVYLSIQNPLYHEFSGGTYRDETYASLVERAIKNGNDGVVLRNTTDSATGHAHLSPTTDIFIVFRPEQIKSAVGNNGDYDPDNDNILFSRSVGDAPAQEAQRVQSAIEGKTLIEAAQFMTRSKDGAKAAVAQKVLEKLQRLEKAGVALDLKVVHRGDMAPASMVNARGYTETGFDEKGRDIVVWLNGADVTGKVGTEEEVLLHELVHAATAGMVFYGTQTPNSLAGKHARDLMAVTDAIAEHIRKRFDAADAGKATLTEFEQDMRDGANNAFRSDDEVLAWALSNSEAQAYLETIPYRSGSMWSNFVQAVRNLLGLSARNDTALSEVLRVAERILTDDAPNAGRAAFWHKRNIRMAQQQVRGSIVQTAERGADDLQFSRSGLENAQHAARNIGAGLKAITAQDVKKAGKHKLTDWLKLGLQFLGRRQIVDVYGDVLPLAEYDRLAAQMEADKNDVGAAADELARRWGKLPDEGKLADLMHDATLAQIDADSAVEYVPGDDLATSRALKAQFNQLSGEAQKVYREARDHYRKHHAAVRQAIIDRIMRSELREERRAELLKRMDADFFKAIKGVYFPLSRFGQYVVVTKDDAGQTVSVSRAETLAEAEAMRAEMVKAYPAKDGYQVGRVILSKEFVAGRDMVGRGFMTELYEALDEQGLDPSVQAELEDTLGQLYLSSLPDLSWAKHGIHRKGTPGFSSDARRAFAQNTFHGARYLAKLKYGDQMQAELDRMQKHVDEMAPIEGFNQPAAQRVVDEMNKRHEATMNPKGNPLSTALTSFGFVYYLGISPAAAMVNLSQTPLVAYPVLGAKWGFRKAGAALMAASAEVVEGKNDLRAVLADRLKNEQDPKAKRKHQDEIAAYDEAVRTGVIDVTMAHDLAGIAQGEDAKVMWKIRPVMRLASYLFHHAERFNRQATFLASYRLARDAGAKHDTAYSQAVKATYDGHFDYSTGNRPRVMQGNVAKVVLLFKQYAQNMIYTLARNAYQSVKGESPEVRREARKVFGALMTMHAAAAGVLGLPMVGTLLTLASALGGSDDEPWDAEVALRNMLADTFGAKPSEVIAKGFSRLTPWDISGRVGLDKLLLPDVNESLEGQRWAESFATAMLGPVIGMGVNAAKGAQKMADGDYGRGLEDMLPIFARNPIKAYRQYSEGEVDRTGVVIKDEVSLAGVLGQASGFSPSEIRLAFEGRSAVMSADRRLNERRQDLMTQFARAAMDQDQGGMAEAREVIAEFNRVNPGRRITPPQMWQSVRNRERRIREADEGVYLPRTRRDVMAEGRFAMAG